MKRTLGGTTLVLAVLTAAPVNAQDEKPDLVWQHANLVVRKHCPQVAGRAESLQELQDSQRRLIESARAVGIAQKDDPSFESLQRDGLVQLGNQVVRCARTLPMPSKLYGLVYAESVFAAADVHAAPEDRRRFDRRRSALITEALALKPSADVRSWLAHEQDLIP